MNFPHVPVPEIRRIQNNLHVCRNAGKQQLVVIEGAVLSNLLKNHNFLSLMQAFSCIYNTVEDIFYWFELRRIGQCYETLHFITILKIQLHSEPQISDVFSLNKGKPFAFYDSLTIFYDSLPNLLKSCAAPLKSMHVCRTTALLRSKTRSFENAMVMAR